MNNDETRRSIEQDLPQGWFLEGPVDFKYGGQVVRARTEQPDASYPDHCGVTAVADSVPAAWKELRRLLAAYRAHPPTERAPQALDSYAGWWEFYARPPYDTVMFPVAKLAAVGEEALQAAWAEARAVLPIYWEISEVTDYLRGAGPSPDLPWAARSQVPFMHLPSDHDYMHMTAWGADPLAALAALSAKLAAWKPRTGAPARPREELDLAASAPIHASPKRLVGAPAS